MAETQIVQDPVFEILILKKPTKEEREAGEMAKLLHDGKVCASTPIEAAVKFALQKGVTVDSARMDIRIRPFD